MKSGTGNAFSLVGQKPRLKVNMSLMGEGRHGSLEKYIGIMGILEYIGRYCLVGRPLNPGKGLVSFLYCLGGMIFVNPLVGSLE